MNYIIFWKDAPGQQVNTVVDATNAPVLRDDDYVVLHGVQRLRTEEEVLRALEEESGEKFAVAPELARVTLGWDV